MKNLVVFILLFCLLLLACVYIFIPPKLEVSKIAYVNCNINSAYRSLTDQNSWAKWWPAKDSLKSEKVENSFYFKGSNFWLSDKFYNSVQISIKTKNSFVNSRMEMLRNGPDSTILIWKCQIPQSFNPLKRILNYRKAEKIGSDMAQIFYNLQSFLQTPENIYGFNFHRTMSKDSTMMAIKKTASEYPTTSEIYDLINELKKFIADKGAKENNFPMLNIKKLKNHKFETMVAIPIDRELQGNNKIFFSRFVPWYVLTAEVRGGVYTVNQALHQMEIYIVDNQKTVMAIPFQSLVTNRVEQPDTLKWITYVYTPIPY